MPPMRRRPDEMSASAPDRDLVLEAEMQRLNDRIVSDIRRAEAAGRGVKLLVVGTGRCGTASAQRALNAVGIGCGHEDVYGPWGYVDETGLEADASWLAVPYLPFVNARIIHLARDPVDVANSFLSIGFFDAAPANVYKDFARRWAPLTGDGVDDAFRWWLEWNRMCERHAAARFRVDEMPALAAFALSALGRDTSAVDAASGLMGERHNRKAHEKSARGKAGIEDISDAGLRDAVAVMATRYGFGGQASDGRAA